MYKDELVEIPMSSPGNRYAEELVGGHEVLCGEEIIKLNLRVLCRTKKLNRFSCLESDKSNYAVSFESIALVALCLVVW